MSVNLNARLRLGGRDERSEENDGRLLQFTIRPDLRRDVTSISDRHYNVNQDQVRLKIPSALMSIDRVIFFENQITARLLQKNFNQVSCPPLIINDEDPFLCLDSWS